MREMREYRLWKIKTKAKARRWQWLESLLVPALVLQQSFLLQAFEIGAQRGKMLVEVRRRPYNSLPVTGVRGRREETSGQRDAL